MNRPWETEEYYHKRAEARERFPIPIKTNADRIRSMSDKELAEWFDLHFSEPLWCVLPECPDHHECVKCILKWLKSFAEEENE